KNKILFRRPSPNQGVASAPCPLRARSKIEIHSVKSAVPKRKPPIDHMLVGEEFDLTPTVVGVMKNQFGHGNAGISAVAPIGAMKHMYLLASPFNRNVIHLERERSV